MLRIKGIEDAIMLSDQISIGLGGGGFNFGIRSIFGDIMIVCAD